MIKTRLSTVAALLLLAGCAASQAAEGVFTATFTQGFTDLSTA